VATLLFLMVLLKVLTSSGITYFRVEQRYLNGNIQTLFCLIRQILLFGLAQKVNKKPKAA
jgi:hypothetical protein